MTDSTRKCELDHKEVENRLVHYSDLCASRSLSTDFDKNLFDIVR